jgi:hypothetical protein
MPFDSLALLACGLIAVSESFAATRLSLAAGLLVTALGLLVAAFRSIYVFTVALLLVGLIPGVWLYRMPQPSEEAPRWKRVVLTTLAPRLVAGWTHLVGVWLLWAFSLWGILGVYEHGKELYIQEIGHLVPASFYYIGLVLSPLLLIDAGFDSGSVEHQMQEGGINFILSISAYLSFRIAHHLLGQDLAQLSASDWDHELLNLVWATGGLVAVLMGLAQVKTSIHVVFPALFICYSMMSHSHSGHDAMGMELWRQAWMKMHQVSGMLFGIGALCRLLYRIPESIFFLFLGAVVFVSSATDVVSPLYDAVKQQDEYATAHVIILVVVVVGAILFPLHWLVLQRLRRFVQQWTGVVTFARLAMDDDEEEGYQDLRLDQNKGTAMTVDTMEEDDEEGHLMSNGNALNGH